MVVMIVIKCYNNKPYTKKRSASNSFLADPKKESANIYEMN